MKKLITVALLSALTYGSYGYGSPPPPPQQQQESCDIYSFVGMQSSGSAVTCVWNHWTHYYCDNCSGWNSFWGNCGCTARSDKYDGQTTGAYYDNWLNGYVCADNQVDAAAMLKPYGTVKIGAEGQSGYQYCITFQYEQKGCTPLNGNCP